MKTFIYRLRMLRLLKAFNKLEGYNKNAIALAILDEEDGNCHVGMYGTPGEIMKLINAQCNHVENHLRKEEE